ncbi:hypothetical protein A6J42_09465 [Leptospira interrogans serovar Copenhageni]|nr:hypothetical protein A6J42_09465 [Leptospira interrogans serovar Copenhageni]ASP42883.1 hypothetical protein AMR47_19470 [Leptospira interrogans]QOI48116.1 hypothetical protein Lepto898_16305 [Leptospira interrogans serovar Icterohaemorrhagiae]KAA5547626.1 hypothetical protein F3G11_18330 [Leptospira interrogans serovar Copenhageni]NUL42190.1 hypothetical protein [Leptospira interrogans serovar Copenhageni]
MRFLLRFWDGFLQFILGNLFLKSVIYSSFHSCFTNKLFIKVVVLTISKFGYKVLNYKSS